MDAGTTGVWRPLTGDVVLDDRLERVQPSASRGARIAVALRVRARRRQRLDGRLDQRQRLSVQVATRKPGPEQRRSERDPRPLDLLALVAGQALGVDPRGVEATGACQVGGVQHTGVLEQGLLTLKAGALGDRGRQPVYDGRQHLSLTQADPTLGQC